MDNGNKWASRIVSYAAASPAALRLNPANWRTHPSHQQEALAGTLDELGWIDDVIVNQRTAEAWGDEQGVETVLDGHLRVKLAQERGEGSIPVKYVDLDPGEEALALATFDPLAALATADRDKLGELLNSIATEDERVLRMLEGLAEEHGLELGGGEPLADPGPQIDKAAELQEIWQTELGQVWELGEHRLACGDSTRLEDVERLMNGEKIRMIVTDPPFAITGSSTGSEDMSGINIITPFFRLWMRQWFSLLPQLGHAYVFCDWRTYALVDGEGKGAGLVPKNCIVWYKGQGGLGTFYQNSHEFIWFAVRQPPRKVGHNLTGHRMVFGISNVWEMTAVTYGSGDDRVIHSASKPPELFVRAIEQSCDKGDIIGDPFAGAGVCYVAAAQTGRVCYGMEIEPKYVAVALQRWADMTGKEPHQV